MNPKKVHKDIEKPLNWAYSPLIQRLICLFGLCCHFFHQPVMNSFVICFPVGGLFIELGCLTIAGQLLANKLYGPGPSILANAINGILVDRIVLTHILQQ